MTVDIENQRRLLVPDNAKMPKWEKISKIIEKDDAKELRQQLEHETLELVARPQDSRHHKTALHAAVESPAPECLKVLLDASPGLDVLDSPDIDGNTPLHAAVKGLNSDAISKLINAGANVNLRNDQGHSPLHLLAYAAATAASGENFDKCVDALLECPSLDLDALNYSKFTPLRAAAEQMPSKTGSLKTFCQKLVQKGANIDEHTRSILVEHSLPNSPDEATTLPQPQTATAELLNLLICNQSEGIADMFSGVCGSQEVRAAANCYLGSKKVLCYLVDRCSEAGVRALLQAGADPWSTNMNGELALHSALARGHLAIVNILINEMKKMNNNNPIDLQDKSFSLLQKALKNNKDADKTATKSYDPNKYECLNRLFEDDVLIDVNQKEEGTDMKQTALHIACKMNNQDAMAILLEHGAYLGEHQMIGEQDNGTVLNALMAKTLEKTMDNCIKVPSQTIEKNDTLDPERKDRILEEDALDLNYILELNYQFLMSPTPREPTKVQQLENEVSLLYDISQSHELRNSIKHPLIQTLIYAKWGKVFPLFHLHFLTYSLFLCFFIGFILIISEVGRLILRSLENLASSSNSTETQLMKEEILQYQSVAKLLVLIITVFMMVKGVFQIAFTSKSYIRCIENYLEWFLIIALLVFCFAPLSASAAQHLKAWVFIALWYNWLLMLGRLPPYDVYVAILRLVSWNFLKLILIFIIPIIAFSSGFIFILQPYDDAQNENFTNLFVQQNMNFANLSVQQNENFANFSVQQNENFANLSGHQKSVNSSVHSTNIYKMLVRTIVMSTGDFEYSSISEELMKDETIYSISSVLMFLLFIFLIFLVLMNVMTGLAVNDVKEIKEDAVFYSLKSKLELVYLNEQLLIKVPFLQRFLPHLQLFGRKQRRLIVKINSSPYIGGIIYDDQKQFVCYLDDRTVEVIRNHRLNRIAAQREAQDEIQKNIAAQREAQDEILQRIAAQHEERVQILQLLHEVRNNFTTTAP